jgi:hypothetical protein
MEEAADTGYREAGQGIQVQRNLDERSRPIGQALGPFSKQEYALQAPAPPWLPRVVVPAYVTREMYVRHPNGDIWPDAMPVYTEPFDETGRTMGDVTPSGRLVHGLV